MLDTLGQGNRGSTARLADTFITLHETERHFFCSEETQTQAAQVTAETRRNKMDIGDTAVCMRVSVSLSKTNNEVGCLAPLLVQYAVIV